MKILAKDLSDGQDKAVTAVDVTTAGLMTTANVYSSIGLDLTTQSSRPANVGQGLWLNNSNELRFYDGSSDYALAHSGTTLVGDVTGTLGATVVGNDSHTHANSTLTGVPGAAIDTTALHSGDSIGGDLSGTYPTNIVVEKIQGDQVYASIAPTDGQVLTWDNANSRWDASTPVSGVTTLAALSDTAISSPSAGDMLLWDGSNSWDNKAMGGDASITSGGVITVTGSTGLFTVGTLLKLNNYGASPPTGSGDELWVDNSGLNWWDVGGGGASKIVDANTSFGGDVSGTYTNLTVSGTGIDTDVTNLRGDPVENATPAADDKLIYSGSQWNHEKTSRVRAYKSGTQAIGLTLTLVTWENETYDTRGDFNTTTDRFVAPETGYYLCLVSLHFSGSPDSTVFQTEVRRNGVVVSTSYDHSVRQGTDDQTVRIYDVIYMTATQYLEVWNANDQGSITLQSGEDETHWEVHKMI